MKIAVIPDGAMIIVSMINRYGHEYLSSTNLSQEKLRNKDPYDDSDFDMSLPPFTMTSKNALSGNKYASCESPSGLRGRMSLFDNIIENSEAAIFMGEPPLKYNHMYDTLNELILFGCVSCGNQYNLVRHILEKKDIPILKLAYPLNKKELIIFIDKIRYFLENLEDNKGNKIIYNDDNLSIDLKKHDDKLSIDDFKDIINEINNKI